MPTFIIIICTILSTGLLLLSYQRRFVGLRRGDYELNPLTPLAWFVTSLMAMIFAVATGNFVLAGTGAVALILQIITLAWSVRVLRRNRRRKWQIKPEDFVCLGMAIAAAVIFRLTGDATAGALIIFVGSILGDVPQLRKDFVAPQTDKIQIYLISALRYAVLTGTLQEINFVGLANSLFWAMFILAELGWLVYCQKRRCPRTRQLALATVKIDQTK